MYPIIHENHDFIIVAKPCNLSVHCDENKMGFAAILADQLGIGLFVVHRLDKVTSGLMIFAKHAEAAAIFGKLFQNREIAKFYIAISDKKPNKKQGSIKGDMQKSRRMTWMLTKSMNSPAITRFKSSSLTLGRRLYLLKPETGKTHQLRVALKSLGSPIIGDHLYWSDTKKNTNQQPNDTSDSDAIKESRCYLHAWQLHFSYAGKAYHFEDNAIAGEYFNEEQVSIELKKWSAPQNLDWPTR